MRLKNKKAKEKKTTDTHTEQYLYTGRAVNVFFTKIRKKKKKYVTRSSNLKKMYEKNTGWGTTHMKN